MVFRRSTILPLLALLALLWLAGCGTNSFAPSTGQGNSGLSAIPNGTGNTPEPGTDNKPRPKPDGHDESLLTAGGLVYMGSDNGKIYAFDAASGAIRWQSEGRAPRLFAIDGGTLYTGNPTTNIFYALNASNGQVLWQRALDTEFNRVLTANGIVYVNENSGNTPSTIYAFRATDGKPLWHYALASASPSLVTVSQGRVYDIPSQDPSSTGKLAPVTVLDASSGHVLWQFTARSGDGDLAQAIAESDGIVYFSTDQGSTYAVQAASGQLLWRAGQPASSFPRDVFNAATPVVMDGTVYTGSTSAVFAYRASDGKQLWRYQATSYGGPPFSIQPLVDHNSVYLNTAGSRANLVALRASDGQVLWRHMLNSGGEPGSLVLADGLLINLIGTATAWRTSDGSQVWQHDTDNGQGPPGAGEPVFLDSSTHTLYAGGSHGVLQVWRVSDGAQLWTYHIPENPVQQAPIYNATITFTSSTSYDQAIQLIGDLGLKTFKPCRQTWVPEGGKDSYASDHILEVSSNTNSAPFWLARLQALSAVAQVQGQPSDAVYSCPLFRDGPVHFLNTNQAGTYIQVSFNSATTYSAAWESMNALGFRLASPCYEQERAQGQKPTWHGSGEESSFAQTHTLVLATTSLNATIWQQQLQSTAGVKQVATLSGPACT